MNQRWRRRVGRVLVVLMSVCTAALLLAPRWAWGRAGGGGGYHGGGGGGGGGGHSYGGGGRSGGGGGSSVDWFAIIIWLFVHPVIGVPLLLLIAWFLYSAYQQNLNADGTSRRDDGAMGEGERAAALAKLREHDPNFDEAAFAGRVRVAFDKIQAAWCGQNLTAVRPFISDGVYERFSLQVDEQRAEGYRDHMEEIRVDSIELVSVAASGLFDEASVRIAAAARDWRESLAEPGRRISGSPGVEPFVEIWTFLRRRGAVTDLSKSGLIEGNCPNCGAPVEMNQSARCTHCKAELRSGEYDWVLTEITQQVEWSVPRRDQIPGVQDLRSRDPGFDPASMEDRASVMFWRRATAERLGKVDPLRKVALPAFADAYAAYLRDAKQRGPRRFPADCAVGSVQMLGVVTDGQWDRSVIEIRWSGKRFIEDGRGPRNTGEELWASELFVLAKQAAAKTDAGKSISSAHCPNCGAPEAGGTSNACEFCGTVLNDGAHGWVLEGVAARDAEDGRALMAAIAEARSARPGDGSGPAAVATPDAMGLLAWMVKVAAADGNVDAHERQLLADVARGRNIPAESVGSMIAAALRGDLQAPAPADAQEAVGWLEAMAAAAWADGELALAEMEMLRSVGRRVGVSDADVNLAVQRGRANMIKRTRADRRS